MTYVTLSFDGLYDLEFNVPYNDIGHIEDSMRDFAQRTATLERRVKQLKAARDSVLSKHQELTLDVFLIPSGEDGIMRELLARIEHSNPEVVEVAAREYITLAGEQPSMIIKGSDYKLARKMLNYFVKELRVPNGWRWLLRGGIGADVVDIRTFSR